MKRVGKNPGPLSLCPFPGGVQDPLQQVIRGERGTRFSGTCSIGGEDRRIGGRVPESYSYELSGKKLECEIRKDGPGTLEAVLAAGDGVRSVHRQTGAGSGIIRLTYSGDGASGVSSSQSQVSSTLDSSIQSR